MPDDEQVRGDQQVERNEDAPGRIGLPGSQSDGRQRRQARGRPPVLEKNTANKMRPQA